MNHRTIITVASVIFTLCLANISTADAAIKLPTIKNPIAQKLVKMINAQEDNPLHDDVWCFRGDGRECRTSELRDSETYRQIIVLPAGYTEDDKTQFYMDYALAIGSMSNGAENIYSTMYNTNLVYRGFWLPAGDLSSTSVNFDAAISDHPVRSSVLTLDPLLVIDAIEDLQDQNGQVSPWAVLVIYNSNESGVTATASTPTLSESDYGIARVTRGQIYSKQGDSISVKSYTTPHELAHAGLDFVDEYVEHGFEEMSINQYNVISPLITFDASWHSFPDSVLILFQTGIYDYQFSEILGATHNNVYISRYPSAVTTAGYTKMTYGCEGGLFFGRGTYHNTGSNLMNGNNVDRSRSGTTCTADGLSFNHSASQLKVIEQTFETPETASRPNDRIRTAGPNIPWVSALGNDVKALIFDADKNNPLHPTIWYDVQVGWWAKKAEAGWCSKTVLGVKVPYPCVKVTKTWKTAEKRVYPHDRFIDLETSTLAGMTGVFQDFVCHIGLGPLVSGGFGFDICEMDAHEIMNTQLPTLKYPAPYQEFTIETQGTNSDDLLSGDLSKTYYWRFKTYNGTYTTNYTAWDSFEKILFF